MQPATKAVIIMQAIINPSVLTSVTKPSSFLYSTKWISVNIVVDDSIKTRIYVNVTVGLIAVF